MLSRNYSLLILFIAIATHCFATQYYVSPSGSDSNTGTIAEPFLTIQHGLDIAMAGDIVSVRSGTYNESLIWTNSGIHDMPILLENYMNEEVIIDGTGIATISILRIENKSYVDVSGLIFENNYQQGADAIYVVGEGNSINITNCIVRNIGWTSDSSADPYSVSPTGQAHAILINGRTSTGISSVKVNDCRIHNITTGNSEALTIVGNVDSFEVKRDTIYDTKNIAIDIAGHFPWAVNSGVHDSLNQARNGIVQSCIVYNNRRISNIDAPAGLYSDGAKNVVFDSNISFQNGNGMSIGCENPNKMSENIIAINNIIYDNDNVGLYFGSNATNSIVKNAVIKNNTFYRNGNSGIYLMEVFLQKSEDCSIIQNIFIPRSSSHYGVGLFGYIVSNLIVDNNLAYRYNMDPLNIYITGSPAQFNPVNSTISNPMFVDTSLVDPDLNLLQNSPAIDKGFLNYGKLSDTDVNNNSRIINGKLDLGAIERQTGNCPDTLSIDNTFILEGIFIAKDQISINIPISTPLNSSMIFSAPFIKVLEADNQSSLLIKSDGCVD